LDVEKDVGGGGVGLSGKKKTKKKWRREELSRILFVPFPSIYHKEGEGEG
jgi:hypothetical protein